MCVLITVSDAHVTPATVRDTKDLHLTMEAIEALEFLIAGSNDSNKWENKPHFLPSYSKVPLEILWIFVVYSRSYGVQYYRFYHIAARVSVLIAC